ncbi:hypothetical protein LINGRAHAP2_LOCUS20799 [Linum grandiflorum]
MEETVGAAVQAGPIPRIHSELHVVGSLRAPLGEPGRPPRPHN